MKIGLNKIDWLRVGLHAGWIKSADLDEEDQNLMDQIFKAKPYVGEMPSEESVNAAVSTLYNSIFMLKEFMEDILDRVKSSFGDKSSDFNNLFAPYLVLGINFGIIMKDHSDNPTRLAKEFHDLSDTALYVLDEFENMYKKYNSRDSGVDLGFVVAHHEETIKRIRRDIVRNRKILERVI
jgi:hypothetical protein